MGTLLQDITTYVTDHPYVALTHLREQFGDPISDTGTCGYLKTYTDWVFLRDGQFVHVQHRNFGTGKQVVRIREVEPMEQTTTTVAYVPANLPTDGNEEAWAHQTGLVPDTDAFLSALSR